MDTRITFTCTVLRGPIQYCNPSENCWLHAIFLNGLVHEWLFAYICHATRGKLKVKTGAFTEQKLFTFYRLSNPGKPFSSNKRYFVLIKLLHLMTLCFYLLATQDEGQLGEAHHLSITLPEVTAGNCTFTPCTCSQLFLRFFRPPNFLLEERHFWISYLKSKQGKQSASLCETSFSVTTWKKMVSPSCLSQIYWQVRI